MTVAKNQKVNGPDEEIEITNGKFKHALSGPTEIEGETYTELEFDFDSLTGRDMIAAAKMRDDMAPQVVTGDQGGVIKDGIMPELNQAYQAFVAARAAKVHPNVILGLKARDYNAVTKATLIFLLGVASAK